MHPLLQSCLNGGGPAAFFGAEYRDQLTALLEAADPAEVAPRDCSRCGSETDPTIDHGVCPGCGRGTWTVSLYDGKAFERTKHSAKYPQKYPSAQKRPYESCKEKGELPPSILAATPEQTANGRDWRPREDRKAMAKVQRRIAAMNRERWQQRRDLDSRKSIATVDFEEKISSFWQEYRIAKIGPRVLLEPVPEPKVDIDLTRRRSSRKPIVNRGVKVTRGDGTEEKYGSSAAAVSGERRHAKEANSNLAKTSRAAA